MYGFIKNNNRLPENRFTYWKGEKYVFVDNGFYDLTNIFTPLPIGLFYFIITIFYPIGIYVIITRQLFWGVMLANTITGINGLGVTGGAHRLYSHKSFKASKALKIFFILSESILPLGSCYSFAVGHRIHHKYSDQDADPHNASRGFLFAHIGWTMRTEHPDVQTKEKLYDFSDLDNDKIAVFQEKHYWKFHIILGWILPITLQMIILKHTLYESLLCSIVRIFALLHAIYFVNSAAHMFGDKPYNKIIRASENFMVTLFAIGEGYHNYHHTYPQDYRTSEDFISSNWTLLFIDIMAYLGFASSRKIANQEMKESKEKIASIKSRDMNDDKKMVIAQKYVLREKFFEMNFE